MRSFTPTDWCWLLPDGRAFLSASGTVVAGDDPAVAAWEGAGDMPPTPCPPDETQTPTLAALQEELARWGLTLPGAPALVPTSVTSAQAKIQLRRAGLRDKVDAAIQAAGGEVLDWFTDARVWERNNPNVAAIGAGLKLKDADIDELFVAASKIAG